MSPVINEILKAFKKKYPKLTPIEIFEISDGYIIGAPDVSSGIDYNDPYYFVSDDFETIIKCGMSKRDEMFKAFSKGAIWTK